MVSNPIEKKSYDTAAILSLVLSIIFFLLMFVNFFFIFLHIISIILAITSIKKIKKNNLKKGKGIAVIAIYFPFIAITILFSLSVIPNGIPFKNSSLNSYKISWFGNIYYGSSNILNFDTTDKLVYLDNVDIFSFKVLSQDFAKDKNNVYYKGKILEGVNPENFTINN